MTDYEKASLILQCAQLNYLHVIAWHATKATDSTDRQKLTDWPKQIALAMQESVGVEVLELVVLTDKKR